MKRSPIQWFLTIAGLSGIVAIFLPFTCYTSPMKAIFDSYTWFLGVPCFLSIFIGILTVRWNFSGSISLPERILGYVAGILTACVTLLFDYKMTPSIQNLSIQDLVAMITSILILVIGGILTVINYRSGKFKDFSPIMAMQTAFLADGIFCLIAFFGQCLFCGWQIGAYFVLVAVTAYFVQIVWIMRCPKVQKLEC